LNQARSRLARRLALSTLTAALLCACYDTPLIPADASAAGGRANHMGGASAGGKPTNSSGAGGKAAASVGGANEAGDSPVNPGGAPAAGAAGQSGGSAGATGQAGDSGAPGITWLDLDGSSAPASSAVNAALDIEGAFYAYSDGCSQLTWVEETRCASGVLCDPQNLANWGMAVGFDFHNTGATGTPPNTKLIWNPNDVGAVGVAWRIHGTAPKIQLWVLNMDPSWHGQCNAMTCEIAGPPDGVAPAPLEGSLLFDHMVKDDWGGTGISYTFDPAAVHALQFKLAAVQVGQATFDFCIDALGIIR
jgi:hypothetical protein